MQKYLFEVIKKSLEHGVIIVSSETGDSDLICLKNNSPEKVYILNVSEQTTALFAAGMVDSGKRVILYVENAIGLTRAYEQIHDFLSGLRNVLIIYNNAGLDLVHISPQHSLLHDLSLARSLPNTKVFIPVNKMKLEAIFNNFVENGQGGFVRVQSVFAEVEFTELGSSLSQVRGKDFLCIVTGSIVSEVVKALDLIEDNSGDLIYVESIPFEEEDKNIILSKLKEYQIVFIIEEHISAMGLLDVILSVTKNVVYSNIIHIAIKENKLTCHGDRSFHLQKNGLDYKSIASTIENTIKNMHV